MRFKEKDIAWINKETGEVKIFGADLLPFDLKLVESSDEKIRKENKDYFKFWCSARVIQSNRIYSNVIFEACGMTHLRTIDERADFALQFYCLSLKDTYWVTSNPNIRYSSVCLFGSFQRSSINNDYMELFLKGTPLLVSNENLLDLSPNLSLDGAYPKFWLQTEGGFEMLKTCQKMTDNLSVCKEVKASIDLRRLGFHVVDYFCDTRNKINVSVSECFTNENIHHITAFMYKSNPNNNIWEILRKFDKDFYRLLLAEYLIGNCDLHGNNWGFLYNDKKEILGFTPTYDLNNAYSVFVLNSKIMEFLYGKSIPSKKVAKVAVKKLGLSVENMLKVSCSEYVKQKLRSLL